MLNLLITLIVVYIATIIIQIGYCRAWYNNDPICHNLSAIITLITSIVFAPIIILFEIGVTLLYVRKIR